MHTTFSCFFNASKSQCKSFAFFPLNCCRFQTNVGYTTSWSSRRVRSSVKACWEPSWTLHVWIPKTSSWEGRSTRQAEDRMWGFTWRNAPTWSWSPGEARQSSEKVLHLKFMFFPLSCYCVCARSSHWMSFSLSFLLFHFRDIYVIICLGLICHSFLYAFARRITSFPFPLLSPISTTLMLFYYLTFIMVLMSANWWAQFSLSLSFLDIMIYTIAAKSITKVSRTICCCWKDKFGTSIHAFEGFLMLSVSLLRIWTRIWSLLVCRFSSPLNPFVISNFSVFLFWILLYFSSNFPIHSERGTKKCALYRFEWNSGIVSRFPFFLLSPSSSLLDWWYKVFSSLRFTVLCNLYRLIDWLLFTLSASSVVWMAILRMWWEVLHLQVKRRMSVTPAHWMIGSLANQRERDRPKKPPKHKNFRRSVLEFVWHDGVIGLQWMLVYIFLGWLSWTFL